MARIGNFIVAAALLCAVILGVFRVMEMVSSANAPLKPQFSIKLPDWFTSTGFKASTFPEEMRWSPDGRTLAVYGSTGKLFLLDVGQKQVSDSNIYFKGGAPDIAWSPDGSMVALGRINVGLFRVADGKELARRDQFRYGRCGTAPRQSVAFTADGRFLWVACGARGERGNYRAAEKFSVPDLELADSVDVEGAEPDHHNYTDYERIVVQDGRMLLTGTLVSCLKQNAPVDFAPGVPNCQRFAVCHDLQTRQRCFPNFVIPRPSGANYPYDLKLVPGRPRLIVFSAWAQAPAGPDPAFEIRDFAGNLVRQFGMRKEFDAIGPRRFVMTGAGFVIGTAGHHSDPKLGRLMMWNIDTGELLQNTRTLAASLIEISPDGRLVAVQIGSEISFYSIN
jgi:hypothetical protein